MKPRAGGCSRGRRSQGGGAETGGPSQGRRSQEGRARRAEPGGHHAPSLSPFPPSPTRPANPNPSNSTPVNATPRTGATLQPTASASGSAALWARRSPCSVLRPAALLAAEPGRCAPAGTPMAGLPRAAGPGVVRQRTASTLPGVRPHPEPTSPRPTPPRMRTAQTNPTPNAHRPDQPHPECVISRRSQPLSSRKRRDFARQSPPQPRNA